MGLGKPDYHAPSKARRAQSKQLRKDVSPAERKLWRAMREAIVIQGTHFRRQVPIGNYIADFCAQGCRLIIEVDGEQHAQDIARAHDAKRDAFLRDAGYRVLRFSTREVNFEMQSVLETICAAIRSPISDTLRDPHP
jgi:very-short-patch-repair endonuclease